MSATKDALLTVLAEHIGIDNGQTVDELVGALAADGHQCTPRQVRALVEQLRAEGHHICAHPGHGYWIAANDAELDLSCKFLRSRALCSLQQEAAMRRVSVPFLLGQLSLLAQEEVMPRKLSPRVKVAAADWVPADHHQLGDYVERIGQAQRERAALELQMNESIAEARSRFEHQAKPYAEAIKQLSEGVRIYAETHRAELTGNGRSKTVRLRSGELRWRLPPPSVSIRGAVDVLAELLRRGLDRFVRTKQEIDREAILAEPTIADDIDGISITQREQFVIVPDATELEQVA